MRKSLWVCIGGTSALRRILVKQSSLVDYVLNDHEIPGVWSLSLKKKFLSSVFIYAEVSLEH